MYVSDTIRKHSFGSVQKVVASCFLSEARDNHTLDEDVRWCVVVEFLGLPAIGTEPVPIWLRPNSGSDSIEAQALFRLTSYSHSDPIQIILCCLNIIVRASSV